MIPQRVRVAFALAVTVSCGATQVAVGLSGDPLQPKTLTEGEVIERWVPHPLPPVTHPPVTTTMPPTTATSAPVVVTPTLGDLIDQHFDPTDRGWALAVTLCESSAQPSDTTSEARHVSSGASGWFQHLPKFWDERSTKAGVPGVSVFDPTANVVVAAWLLYSTPQGKGHWNESKHCWG